MTGLKKIPHLDVKAIELAFEEISKTFIGESLLNSLKKFYR